MRKLVYLIAMTIDGYISSAPTDNPDFYFVEGPQASDLLEEFPDMIPTHVRPLIGMAPETPNRRFDTVLMGRNTYEIAARSGITSPYSHLRQIVISGTFDDEDHPEVEVWNKNVRERVQQLKREDGADIWLCGGSSLATALVEDIDEMILKISPVVLGSGVPLFDDRVGPRHLTLTDHRVYDNGFALVRYQQS
ncbi:MAG TPA: dihydrofolate reductase family protein [Thermomicrobiales bacterium]|nr:dihydrofolate reductase family protein [Thermomicrobiales bacterium]